MKIQNKNLVFVLMPYGTKEYQGGVDEANFVFEEIIKPGVELANEDFNIEREIDKTKSGLITSSIIEYLAQAEIVIADVTGRNPNVFLELGIRYSLRNKLTILINQDPTQIPFDMRGYRNFTYNKFKPDEARKAIAKFIRTGQSRDVESDSIVFDTFKKLSVHIPGLVDSYGESHERRTVMSWNEYKGKLEWVIGWLLPSVEEGRYIPDYIMGISNGGLIVADLVGKKAFSGKSTPVISLWAKRYTNDHDYFENPINDNLMEFMNKFNEKNPILKEVKPLHILLVDDHYGTGDTSIQAVKYLEKKLSPKPEILFLPLVSKRTRYFSKVNPYLPFSKLSNVDGLQEKCIFNITEDEFKQNIHTEAEYFPYFNKEVSEEGTRSETITSIMNE